MITAYVFYKKDNWTLSNVKKKLLTKRIKVYDIKDCGDSIIAQIISNEEAFEEREPDVYTILKYINNDVSAFCLYKKVIKEF